MHMTVHDRLTCNLMAVDADVETFDRFVTCKDIGSNLIQEKVDGSPLRLVQVGAWRHGMIRLWRGVTGKPSRAAIASSFSAMWGLLGWQNTQSS
jgi:hypothetical protein